MPWMTGTAVNPILRAAHLARTKERHHVTLCVPWVPPEDQPCIFAHDRFEDSKEQERCMRRWARDNLGFWPRIDIKFYAARYWASIGSIVASEDLTECVEERDVAVLEEPEHLTWFHAGHDWRARFPLVLGVVHTDYLSYRRADPQIWSVVRPWWAWGWQLLNSWVTRAYCDQVIKLSDAVQEFPKSVTCNVHGVRQKFLDVGRAKAGATVPRFQKGVYYIGKALWAKGYTQLVENMREHRRLTGQRVELDVYGTGPDLEDIKRVVAREDLGWRFMGSIDHADPSLWEYKVLLNPSLSDVVCTTSAEALAMGKFVVCAQHPSNRFFSHFSSCFTYTTPAEFSLSLQHALAAEPVPLSPDMSRELSWEAATDRLYAAARLPGPRTLPATDRILSALHRRVCRLGAAGAVGTVSVGSEGPVGGELLEEPPRKLAEEEERQRASSEARALTGTPSVSRQRAPGPELPVKAGKGRGGLALAASLSLLGGILAAATADANAKAAAAREPEALELLIAPVREAVRASRRAAAVATQVPPGGENVEGSRGRLEEMRVRQQAGQLPGPASLLPGLALPWSR